MCNGNERVKGSACANDVISLLARRPIARAMLASKEEAEKSSPFIEAHSKGLSEARAASMKEVETQRSIKVSIPSGKKPMVEKPMAKEDTLLHTSKESMGACFGSGISRRK